MAPKKAAAVKPVKKKKEKEIKIRHILCKDEKKINDAYAMFDQNYLQKGEEISADTFGAVATRISDCPSAKKGGALGWFGKGKLEDDFERVAFSMRENNISHVFKGTKGWHMVYLEQTREK
eukprot:TRINITY_DN33937_c0_g1_i1.p1 TRINITY_DN33937_c0_g1~~TRINITY_DN33937_c0_g1_i1.p1  ORF type:complete len:138 (+),score=46.74 TRINITY_DN33937_c0_g1_i1:54-416(+)